MTIRKYELPKFKYKQSITDPPDLEKSIVELYDEIVKNTHYGIFLKTCNHVLALADESIKNPSLVSKIKKAFKAINSQDFDDFIRILNITLFIQSIEVGAEIETSFKYKPIPVTHAIETLLNTTDMGAALDLLELNLVDVLTAHPVDMDRGIVVNLKRHIIELTQSWEIEKRTYA